MNAIQKRLKQLSELGHKQNLDYTVERALEILVLSRDNVNAMKQMSNTEGWQILKLQVQKQIDNNKALAFSYSGEPVKNADKLIVCYSTVKSLEKVLSLVENTIKRQPSLEKEYALLQETG